MEIRLTRRPGQAGTKKFIERYDDRLVCVRYRYNARRPGPKGSLRKLRT